VSSCKIFSSLNVAIQPSVSLAFNGRQSQSTNWLGCGNTFGSQTISLSQSSRIQFQAVSSHFDKPPNFYACDGSIRYFDFGIDEAWFTHNHALLHAKAKDEWSIRCRGIALVFVDATAFPRPQEEMFDQITR